MVDLYRKNVGIVVANKEGKVLMCARADQKDYHWQFPQGGIETNETVLQAAKRELYEETGLNNVTFLQQMPELLRYEFPKNAKTYRFAPYVGQEQAWFLFLFDGENSEINFFVNPEEIEFKAFEWVDIEEAPKRIISFKKQVYQKVANFFKPRLEELKNGH